MRCADSFGDLVLAYNPTKSGRNPLDLGISKDNGHTWDILAVLNGNPNNFLSYPTSVEVVTTGEDCEEEKDCVYTVYTNSGSGTTGIMMAVNAL